MNTASVAAEHRHNTGTPDYDLSFELSEFAEDEAEAERLEAEGRREMYATLFGGWEGMY